MSGRSGRSSFRTLGGGRRLACVELGGVVARGGGDGGEETAHEARVRVVIARPQGVSREGIQRLAWPAGSGGGLGAAAPEARR